MLKIYDYSNESEIEKLNKYLMTRSIDDDFEVSKTVRDIFENIKSNGDTSLFDYTKKFDDVFISKENVKVTMDEIENSYSNIDENLLRTIRQAKKNIEKFHIKQREKDYEIGVSDEISLKQLVRPMDIVGIYVPGGTAPLPSTVLMNAIPAKIAGVSKIVMVTPPKKEGVNDAILVAAHEAGVDEIYKVGGAQAICALAIGTQSIPKVDKIVGPGNIFVASAKKLVFGLCDIDMIAGPSEILIVADASANPKYIAADMLSQAEHDVRASSILVTTSKELMSKVGNEIDRQLKYLSRNTIAGKSINDNGFCVLVQSIEQAAYISNKIAPEHLELIFKNSINRVDEFRHAGSIFIGQYSPEPLGDYFAGTNHVLPTSGTARFSSPLGVYDFMKKTQVIYYSKEELSKVKDDIEIFANSEKLDAHANAIKIRFEE